jgi:hypothetical protein
MKRLILTLAVAVAVTAWLPVTAQAEFAINDFDVSFTEADGSPAIQAGSHPFQMTTSFGFNYEQVGPGYYEYTVEELKDATIDQVPGFVGDTTVMPRCSTVDFFGAFPGQSFQPKCSDDTVIGYVGIGLLNPAESLRYQPVFNIEPPNGVPAEVGFSVLGVRVTSDVGVRDSNPYNVLASLSFAPQPIRAFSAKLTLWGNPADPAHDSLRGTSCLGEVGQSLGNCPTSIPNKAFLTLPRACTGPLETSIQAYGWSGPDAFDSGSVFTHDDATPPNPQGFTGCGKLGFAPRIEAQTTTNQAETGTGLDFNVDVHDEGLASPGGLAQSEARKAVVTLPEGATINPSIGEGLGVCTPADLDRETLRSNPGEGCPNSSKVGTLHLETPIAEEPIEGSVFLAQQDDPVTTTPGAENPFDSLIALYLVLKNTDLGVNVKLPLKVEPDPSTGRLVATLENIPQVPFSRFNFHFREGVRAALVTPSACGSYTTEAVFTPWANPSEPLTTASSFEITKGKGGGSCPPGGIPPFHPDFAAGSINNNAGSFSPFNMRLIREDGEQDMTKFSAVLPPGELGSLAGVAKCPDSAIGIARSKTGRQELASPSCPANSLIGHTLAGAGVGSALTYVRGQVYLGGPFHGDPLSVIAVTPAVAGPFDAGTVVVQLALTLNPKTAEVEVDGANSDPIPHILKGIVLKLRDLRVYVDRPNFTLNPTSCDESSARSVLFGSYLDVLSPSDDKPVDLSTRYQAANCLNLGFKPKLDLTLKGGTTRGGHPGLRAIYTPKKGDANVKGLVVRLPRSAFLDQAHIKTICTRVQFAAKSCPKASRYGYIKAYTPLLETPLEGPVYLRSSNHKLPDLVFDLHGLVDIEVATRIDSQKGGIRATVENAPDAPLSKVDLRMQGGKKGLIINSRNLCGHVSKATVAFTGQNGKEHSGNPVMKADCGGKRKSKPSR